MPLPEPSEQESASMKTGQEPSPETGTDVAPAAPTDPADPNEYFNLVLVTVCTGDGDGVDSLPKEVHCAMSLEMSGPDTLGRTLQTLPAEEQGGPVQPGPQALEQKCSQPDTAAPRPLEFLRTPFGGRLLVLESFLYKQEKAVGDRVYWKCREHTERGCRGRAITRGLRATARRRKQKLLRSPALPEGLGSPQVPTGQVEEPLKGVGPRLCPEEPEPAPEQNFRRSLSMLTLPLRSLPLKKRRLLMFERPPFEFLKTCYGGSFLVHKSFLYKREKAVGDKVYWTCRDHVLHGCRSRAITQGQRVTVMRGHCHPPDMEGLQARRQQEKTMATQKARPGGPGGQVDKLLQGGPEFLRTPLGGSFLVHESFLYRREKAAGNKVYWTCRDQARMRCRSRAITQGQQVTVMRGHCHPPDLMGLETLRQREKRPGVGQRGSSGDTEFLRTPLGGSFLVHESFIYRREKATGDKVYWTCRDQARMRCRSRAITQGQRVMPLEFLKTSLGGRFLVHECFLYRKEKAAGEKVYWMCRDQARLRCRSRAITQGQQVTVMRAHCHMPDLVGLEALRRRERLPIAAQQEDPVSMIPWQELFLAVGASPDVHRQSAWSRLRLAEAAVSWVSHGHRRQEERQTWWRQTCISFSSLVTAELA
ncbi:FLYWCH-type zinc finger-containing protein 1 [Myotis davidii]|uniref:FLYWCH-type zinc finger-containing protein 1 n=1 Tax=Myotis davidii TaxID=225400 RepID=L5MFB6_MYODS|nr:FLYWCH-type zinc finger-containing protein 1 [Myotis davidii]